jgi:hypothetical protein
VKKDPARSPSTPGSAFLVDLRADLKQAQIRVASDKANKGMSRRSLEGMRRPRPYPRRRLGA